MYTQCPQCNKQQTITVAELRSTKKGKIWCDGCSSLFDALVFLQDGPISEKQPSNETVLAIENPSQKSAPIWHVGLIVCLLFLGLQIYFFESYNLTQNTVLRPWLEKTCHLINCTLPIYKNLDEITILQGSFEPSENEQYVFTTTLINQSAFVQNYPSIKLTLIDFTGVTFAERIFRPKDYSKNTVNLIASEMPAKITLNIAMPANKVGGYRFELI